MRVLDLFSGIGGFSLGLERAGMETVAFCEQDKFCQKVLKKHWPNVPIYDDVRTIDYDGAVDLICGGFPCQDISLAGKQGGIYAQRSGLWGECVRHLSYYRPKYAIFENVAALLVGESGKWFSRVLTDLAKCGYDAEWHNIPASAIGAPHRRERVWIIAHSLKNRWVHDGSIFSQNTIKVLRFPSKKDLGVFDSEWLLNNGDLRDIRKDNGISSAVDRIGALGNAVVPQIPEIIGKAIIQAENSCNLTT